MVAVNAQFAGHILVLVLRSTASDEHSSLLDCCEGLDLPSMGLCVESLSGRRQILYP